MSKQQMTVASPSTRGLMDASHPQSVLSKLSEQQAQGLFCDVTIVVEDVKFQAHRNVLAATSGYFRNALTSPEVRTTSQVLELMDLRSEVFANILNFLYNSSVIALSTEETKSLVAAGRRLGIPYLERLLETNKEGSAIAPVAHRGSADTKQHHRKHTHHKRPAVQPPLASPSITSNPESPLQKKETPRPKERVCATAKGPRITNAFSITEVSEGDNPFTPLEQQQGGRLSPSLGLIPTACPDTNTATTEGEPAQALSEHSYAVVSQSTSQKSSTQPPMDEAVQDSDTRPNNIVSTPVKTLTSRNFGPIKKRHRLPCTQSKVSSTSSETSTTPQEFQTDNCHPLQQAVAAPQAPPLSPLSLTTPAMVQTPSSNPLPCPDGHSPPPIEPEPPSLSPQETITEVADQRCEYCSETFSNRALLNIHSQVHKRRFVSHLFCKHCHRKFIHLKRLRNHEQMCPRASKGPPQLEPQATPPDQATDQLNVESDAEDLSQTLPPLHLTDTFTLDPTLENPLAPRQLPTAESLPEKNGRGHRTYKCSMCKRTYVTLSSLKRHENVHSWHRAYPCHYCNKVFALAEYRTKHEIWHTGERRYQCIFCLETFMTYYILKNHQKAFHGIDPRLAVKKKAANGGFKGSVYPIKLYRLLPMKFRKKRYKSYSQTFSNTADEPPFCATAVHDPPMPDGQFPGSLDGVCSGQSLLSMPVTFMATPKTVAVGMPLVSFERPCDQDMEVQSFSDVDMPSISSLHPDRQDEPSDTEDDSSLFGYTRLMEPDESIGMEERDAAPLRSTGSHKSNHAPSVNPRIPTESCMNNRLSDLSNAAHTIEAMASQLLLPSRESLKPNKSVGSKTETYIAKPACPGPSIDGQVLPLCHITVKIGNEAIIRRKIKGSKLFPKKRKRKGWALKEGGSESNGASDSTGSPSLRLRTEVTASIVETDPYDDPADPETDKLWRPYYSYKPKKKGRSLRSKHKMGKSDKYNVRPVSPEVSDNCAEEDASPLENLSAGNTETKRALRSNSPKTAHACTICKSLFSNEASLQMHALSCNQYDCRICGKRASTEEILQLGIPLANGGQDFVCEGCREDGSGSFFDNMNPSPSPSTEKRYRCSYCPQRFLYLATKRSHEKKHQEKCAKGYSCQYCSKVCKTTAHLALHEKRHFIKTEESDNEDEEVDVDGIDDLSHRSFAVAKEKTKVEPWDSLEISTTKAPKEEESTPSDSEDALQSEEARNGSKTTPVPSPRTENPFLVSLSELQKNAKHKRKYILDRPKSFGLEGQKNESLERRGQNLKGRIPSLGLNSHCSSGGGFSSFLTRDLVTKESVHQVTKHGLSKTAGRLWADETYFHGHK